MIPINSVEFMPYISTFNNTNNTQADLLTEKSTCTVIDTTFNIACLDSCIKENNNLG